MTIHGDDPWAVRDPWTQAHPVAPVVDEDTAAVLDEAIATLVLLRPPASSSDALAALNAVADLRAEVDHRLAAMVADALEHGFLWSEIGKQLSMTAT